MSVVCHQIRLTQLTKVMQCSTPYLTKRQVSRSAPVSSCHSEDLSFRPKGCPPNPPPPLERGPKRSSPKGVDIKISSCFQIMWCTARSLYFFIVLRPCNIVNIDGIGWAQTRDLAKDSSVKCEGRSVALSQDVSVQLLTALNGITPTPGARARLPTRLLTHARDGIDLSV